MVALRPPSLYTWQYDVENKYDYLTVGGTQFKGDSGPNGVKMSKGDALLWKSDGSVVEEGWKVCTTKGPGQCSFHSHSDSHQRTQSQSLTLTLTRLLTLTPTCTSNLVQFGKGEGWVQVMVRVEVSVSVRIMGRAQSHTLSQSPIILHDHHLIITCQRRTLTSWPGLNFVRSSTAATV